MSSKRIGALRRSQVVSTYGPGAVVDFRAPGTGAPISGVLMGLEWWDDAAPQGHHGLSHTQVIHEVRLQKRLHVAGFRLPPVKDERKGDKTNDTDVLPVVRFPTWLQCPRCDRIAPASGKSSPWAGKTSPTRTCASCSREAGDDIPAVPVRFIVACEDGHLDEFPWKAWIGCRCARPNLFLRTVGPGLAGKVVQCAKKGARGCGSQRNLDGCFGKKALTQRGMTCRGREPWLIRDDEAGTRSCSQPPRVLQRGASNVYWGKVMSALDIPPFSADLSNVFGRFWDDVLKDAEEGEWPSIIKLLKLDKKTGHPPHVLLAYLREWKAAVDADEPSHGLEWGEYVQFRQSGKDPVDKGEFRTNPSPVPVELKPWLKSVVQASRLREVRAQVGFTRITPPGGAFSATQPRKDGHIFLTRPDWLPAIEHLGEGIFIRLDLERLRTWESSDLVKERVADWVEEVDAQLNLDATQDRIPVDEELAARFIMLHSLSHALMRRLSLDCGYSSSALMERLYVGPQPREMAGLLIHTGAADSEGTLGGLVRQGSTQRIAETFLGALHEMSWCSSDPVCITGTATLSSPRNGAACHACLLVPETSCRHFNVLLDRALLVGLPSQPELGYFRHLLPGVV